MRYSNNMEEANAGRLNTSVSSFLKPSSSKNSGNDGDEQQPRSTNTQDFLVMQFNARLVSSSKQTVDRSVAEFLLEMCGNDVDAAVTFYRAQKREEERTSHLRAHTDHYPRSNQASAPIRRTRSALPSTGRVGGGGVVRAASLRTLQPRPTPCRLPPRIKSLDSSLPSSSMPSPPPSQRHRPLPSLDMAEAPVVTSPPASRHHRRRCRNSWYGCATAAPTITTTATRIARSSKPLAVYGRSKSEIRFVRDDPPTVSSSMMSNLSRSHHEPRTSNSNSLRSMLSSSAPSTDKTVVSTTSCPPTAIITTTTAAGPAFNDKHARGSGGGRRPSLGRNLSGRQLEKLNPSAQAA